MFAEAIEKNSQFTRSIHFIYRNFNSTEVIPGSATLFFINDEGVAITCKHVAEEILKCKTINSLYKQYKDEISLIPEGEDKKFRIKVITEKYHYNSNITAQMEILFYDCVNTDGNTISFSVINHDKYDLAIIKINNAISNIYKGHAVFANDTNSLRRGEFLCRIGYPFPEFSNYIYDSRNDIIEWTQTGRIDTPLFPIEGMFTREVISEGKTFAYEISTPGLRGQSGGPLFNKSGIIYGMQFETVSLHLGFDLFNKEVRIDGQIKEVDNHPFMHVGRCICNDVIKKFLDENNIKYYVDNDNGGEKLING